MLIAVNFLWRMIMIMNYEVGMMSLYWYFCI